MNILELLKVTGDSSIYWEYLVTILNYAFTFYVIISSLIGTWVIFNWKPKIKIKNKKEKEKIKWM